MDHFSAPKEAPEEVSTPFEDPGDDAQSVADIRDPDDYREIFQPKHNIGKLYYSLHKLQWNIFVPDLEKNLFCSSDYI